MDDDILVDTAAPISLHPAVFEEGLTDDLRPYVSGAIAAFTSAVTGLSDINALRQVAMENTSLTPDARILEVSAFADRKVAEIVKKIDAADAALKNNIAMVEADLQKPLEAGIHSLTAAEVRQLVRAMPAGERRKLVMDSIESNDMTVLGSVLGAHPLLSGLTPLEKTELTRLYRVKAAPHLAQRLAVMQKAKETLNDHSGLVFKRAEQLIGADRRRVSELRSRAAKMQRALAK